MPFVKKKKIRVFHGLVNYGTQAGILAQSLREHSISALSVAGYDRYKRLIDVELYSGKSITKRFFNWVRLFTYFFKFNIFHFYFGTSLFPSQMDLPFYRMFGKKIVMHYLGNDVQGYKKSVEKYKWTNMPEYIGNGNSVLHDSRIQRRLAFELKYTDLAFVCAPLYSEFVPSSKVLPLAIDLNKYAYTVSPYNKVLEIMHAPTHKGFKGTSYIVNAIGKLIAEGYPVKLNLVENITHDQLKEEYKKCDIFIDQILSGWYGTASLEAMATGRPVICSIRKSYFKYISYGDEIPIIHADPDCIYDSILYLIKNREMLPEIGIASREFVEKVHDHNKIVVDLIQEYKNLYL